MSLPDIFGGNPIGAGLQAVTLGAALAALVVSWHLARRAARERRRVESMQRDLQAFAEASTRVADTLDHLLRGSVEPAAASTSSRRYVLHKARERLEDGESIDALSQRLDLCEDERRLLEFLHKSGAPAPQVRVA